MHTGRSASGAAGHTGLVTWPVPGTGSPGDTPVRDRLALALSPAFSVINELEAKEMQGHVLHL